MRVEILGPARAYDEGRPVALGGPRVRALLVLLALDAGRVVTADRLIDGLYGSHPPEGAANALQSQISRLRRALGKGLVEFHPAGYRLAVERDAIDAHRFERLAAEGSQALAGGDHARAAGLLRQALAEWRGEQPVDAPSAASARLEELRLSAVEDRIQAELELGGHRELVAELRELAAAHPLRERLRAQLMRALYGSGRQAEALAVYEAARRVLDDELGIEPGSELAAAHLAVLRADPALGRPTGPVTAAPASRQGLRAQLTSFVGRDGDLGRVGALLGEARLVTLIGPGGAGKTRLAAEAADRMPGDVCVVPLAPISSGVAWAALDALGVREAALVATADRPVADPLVRLTGVLAGRELVLVLDNCEHLIGEAAELADLLLASCPGLRILATSREALGITGETLAPVAPLALPHQGATVEQALANPAVRLLADRAAAVQPGFAVDEGSVGDVVSICRALDGLPLAIELAAARLRSLSVAEVADRLGDRFRLLTRGSRTALPRHQTLHAVVAWSWDLLAEEERTLARRLTVFVGGAPLEASVLVCGLPEDVLASLVDKSLVFVDGGRYRMLDTIRAFCAERLAESGEVDDLREAHARYYLDLAATADAHLRTADQLAWLERLDGEREDLHAAVRWAIDGGRVEFGLRLVSVLGCYWWMRGQRVVSSELAADLLGLIGPGHVEGMEEEYAMCVLLAASTGAISPELGARMEQLSSLLPYGSFPYRVEFLTLMLPMFTGPPADFDILIDLTFAQQSLLTPWMSALTHAGAAFTWQNRGEIGEAERQFALSIAAFRSIGDRWGGTIVIAGLADLCLQEGDYLTALAHYDEALAMAEQLDAVADLAEYLSRRADCLVGLGDLRGAETGYLRAAELAARSGATDADARAHLGLGELARLAGDNERAKALLDQALASCPTGWYSAEDCRLRILIALGRLAADQQELEEAWRFYVGALTTASAHSLPLAAVVISGLAEVARLGGDDEAARLLTSVPLEQALELAGKWPSAPGA